MKNKTKYQNYLLGKMGEILARQMFTVTLPGDNSHDFKLPLWEIPQPLKIEVKTCRPTLANGSVGYKIDYTRQESKSDYFCVICLNNDLTLDKIFWIPNKKIPKRHRAIWFGKYSSEKYARYRLV